MSFRFVLQVSPNKDFSRLPDAIKWRLSRWRALYRKYLELVRVLQEHGVPAKPVSPEIFKKPGMVVLWRSGWRLLGYL